jgi:hypothetical protein
MLLRVKGARGGGPFERSALEGGAAEATAEAADGARVGGQRPHRRGRCELNGSALEVRVRLQEGLARRTQVLVCLPHLSQYGSALAPYNLWKLIK